MSTSDSYIKPLADDKALDSGAEFIGEFIAYSTLILWGVYEIDKFSKEAKEKENKQNQAILNIHAKIQAIDGGYKEITNKLDMVIKEIQMKKYADQSTDTDD